MTIIVGIGYDWDEGQMRMDWAYREPLIALRVRANSQQGNNTRRQRDFKNAKYKARKEFIDMRTLLAVWGIFGVIVLVGYLNDSFESLFEWETRYISGNDVPADWKTGEWTTYKTTFPNKARAYIRDSWSQAKQKHHNSSLRKWVREYREYKAKLKRLKPRGSN